MKERLTKEQIYRLIVGALKQVKKEHIDFNSSSFAKRLSGLIYGFIFNDDGVEKGEVAEYTSSSPS